MLSLCITHHVVRKGIWALCRLFGQGFLKSKATLLRMITRASASSLSSKMIGNFLWIAKKERRKQARGRNGRRRLFKVKGRRIEQESPWNAWRVRWIVNTKFQTRDDMWEHMYSGYQIIWHRIIKYVPGSPSDLNTGNRIEGATGCPSWCRPLRPLFHFLCSNLKANPVEQSLIPTVWGIPKWTFI